MDAAALLDASRREHALYLELVAAYRAIAAALGDGGAPCDPARLASHDERAQAAVAEIWTVAAELAPHRMTGAPVSEETRAHWRESARLAAEAARMNTDLSAFARARRAALAERLDGLAEKRRGLAGYRPPGARRAALADERA